MAMSLPGLPGLLLQPTALQAARPLAASCRGRPAASFGPEEGSASQTNLPAVSAAVGVLALAAARPRRRPRKFRPLAATALRAASSDSVKTASSSRSAQMLRLKHLGDVPSGKALAVNLDPLFYGSFAEIGAAQEVSRNFLTAGAAAGTVARTISAYDMRMSDVSYGKSKRYVTQERLEQMLDAEYAGVESTLREARGDQTRFFSFASTVAAKAFNSDRECEGWLGLKYQAEVGAEPSTVSLHVRMSDPSAQLQGESIGVLGTNLIYLCWALSDPYLITSFLLDGLELNDGAARGRIEVDFISFSGPAFPEASVDARLLALRMIQLRLANGVLLEPGEDGKYKQVVPNSALYKRPVIVERSRFTPVTYMHLGVMEACTKKLLEEAGEGDKPPMQILNMQVDDITQPVGHVETKARLMRMKTLVKSDENQTGSIAAAELKAMASAALLSDDVTSALLRDLDPEQSGSVSIDALFNISGKDDSLLATEFLDRFAMLEPLKFPVLLSSIRRTHKLSEYISRYTREKIVVAVGGGSYSIQRALFNQRLYIRSKGGMLEAFGRLFAKGKGRGTRVFTYPGIDAQGQISQGAPPEGDERQLYDYLVSQGSIVPLGVDYMSPEARDPSSNQIFRFSSSEVQDLISAGSSEWADYVPKASAEIGKSGKWFARLSRGEGIDPSEYKFLNDLL